MDYRAVKNLILECLEEKKAENIRVIESHKKSSITSYIIIASGRSNKNVGAIGEYVADELKKKGLPQVKLEGFEVSEWILVDAGSVLLHLFHPETRERYKLEELWDEEDFLSAKQNKSI